MCISLRKCSVIAPTRWTIATTANIMVFKCFNLQAGAQVYLIKWLVGCQVVAKVFISGC